MRLRPSQVIGHDGKTADLPSTPKLPESPVISKAPFINSAVSVCGTCGTHEAHSGRPGKRVNGSFACRTCRETNVINGGRGYVFEGKN